ncbi:hypothetical protein [Actinoplanes sp. NPDC051851]|uniref:hypothetical protein n=1 Tax=Actinoplanes sp. NPDC051851 TaxID=3154753 RepID=UPI003427DF02
MRDYVAEVWLSRVAGETEVRRYAAAAQDQFLDMVEREVVRIRLDPEVGAVAELADRQDAGEADTALLDALFPPGHTTAALNRGFLAAKGGALGRAARRRTRRAGLWRVALHLPRFLAALAGTVVAAVGVYLLPTGARGPVGVPLSFLAVLAWLHFTDWRPHPELTPAGRAAVDEIGRHEDERRRGEKRRPGGEDLSEEVRRYVERAFTFGPNPHA